jgi:hypothetical protein
MDDFVCDDGECVTSFLIQVRITRFPLVGVVVIFVRNNLSVALACPLR